MTKQTDNTPTVVENGNNIEEIYYTFAKDLVATLVNTYNLKKNLTIGILDEMQVPWEVIANTVNTSYAYVKSALSDIRRKPKLKQKFGEILMELPNLYRSSCRAQLPLLAKAESRAVLKYIESPELLIERPALGKQIKQGAGITFGDELPSTVNVNVGQIMQNILVQARQPAKAIELDVIDAEIAEVTND